jgi:hypothetical protein
MKTTWKTWAAAMMAVVGMIPLGCTGSVVEIGAQPPGCPSTEPKAGSSCSVTASGCTYAEGPCKVELSCDAESGAWQSQTTSCAPMAKECWSAQEGDVCAVVGDGCGESPGPCALGFFNTCGPDHLWHSSSGGDTCCSLDGPCPASEPADGSPCDPCSGPPSCNYPGTCGGDVAICGSEGQWHIGIGECPPPPPPDYCTSNNTQSACETDPECRWLTPGCGPETPLWSAGCFTKTDCAPDSCDPSQICQTFSYDPCFEKGCDACGADAHICVGGL